MRGARRGAASGPHLDPGMASTSSRTPNPAAHGSTAPPDALWAGVLHAGDSLVAVEVEHGRDGAARARRGAVAPLPAGNPGVAAVVDGLRALWAAGSLDARRVVLGLPARQCGWRRLELSPATPAEHAAAARAILEQEGALAPDDRLALLPLPREGNPEQVAVVAVSVPAAYLRSWEEAVYRAGLTLHAAEPLPLAAARVAAAALPPSAEAPVEAGAAPPATVAVLAPGVADLVIHQGGAVRFPRRIRGEWHGASPAPAPTIPSPSPGAAGARADIPPASDTRDPVGAEATGEAPGSAPEDLVQHLHGEIRRSIAFSQRLAPGTERPQGVYLAAADPQLDAFLEVATSPDAVVGCRRLRELADPLLPAELGGEACPERDGDRLALALGLALRCLEAPGGESFSLPAAEVPPAARPTRRARPRRGPVLVAAVLAVNLAGTLVVRHQAALHAGAAEQLRASLPAAAASVPAGELAALAAAEQAESWPERWLTLLGAIAGPGLQLTSLEVRGARATLTATAPPARAVEALTALSTGLGRYLPLQEGPLLSLEHSTTGHTRLRITLQHRPAAPVLVPASGAPPPHPRRQPAALASAGTEVRARGAGARPGAAR